MNNIKFPNGQENVRQIEAPKTADIKEQDKAIDREKLLVSLKEKAAVLKKLEDNGVIATVDARAIEAELDGVIKKLEEINV